MQCCTPKVINTTHATTGYITCWLAMRVHNELIGETVNFRTCYRVLLHCSPILLSLASSTVAIPTNYGSTQAAGFAKGSAYVSRLVINSFR